MSMTKTCPYGGEVYEAKYKNSPHCGSEECTKAHKREINRRVWEAKKRHKAPSEKQQVENIPSAKTSHPEDPIMPPPVRRAPIQAEAVIEIDGQVIRIPLVIQLDIKVEVNASRD